MTNKELAEKALDDFLREKENFGPGFNMLGLTYYDESWTDFQMLERLKKAFELGRQYPESKLEKVLK